jgi:protein-S-isoprenylcysteine O-methyltransferase Ste14
MDNKKENAILGIVLTVAAVGQMAACLTLYNSEGNALLRNLGWMLLTVSAVFGWLPIYTFRRKGRVSGRGYIHTTVVVDSGIYGIVRHPQYLAGILMSVALALIAQNWAAAVLGAVSTVMYYINAPLEEKNNVEKFGEAYVQYMGRVPRLNFIAGMAQAIRRRMTK